jgi:hypothetical protein
MFSQSAQIGYHFLRFPDETVIPLRQLGRHLG